MSSIYKKYRLLAFDWDGTLCDSIGPIVNAFQQTALQFNYPCPSAETIKAGIGLEFDQSCRAVLPDCDDKLSDIRADFVQRYAQISKELFPDVKNVLKKLQENHFHLAISTGMGKKGIDQAIKTSGLEEVFDVVLTAECTRSKPHPMMLEQLMDHFSLESSEVLMIGDAVWDIQMAHNAGVDAVAIASGAVSKEDLLKEKPLYMIDGIAGLLSCLDINV
jgi:phosphoglycolate phosphatase